MSVPATPARGGTRRQTSVGVGRPSPVSGRGAASNPRPDAAALAAEPSSADTPLSLPHPDWLHHTLTVTGPAAEVAAFRRAARGAGITPWVYDYDRMAEDWFHWLVAPPPPLTRTISVSGARILANDLRDTVWEQHQTALSRVGRSTACPFDLHALVPVPEEVLRLGPDDPGARAWLWAHWGTSWGLRRVEAGSLTRAEQAAIAPGHGALRCRFWAADWTPWPAIATVRRRWPALRIDVRPEYTV